MYFVLNKLHTTFFWICLQSTILEIWFILQFYPSINILLADFIVTFFCSSAMPLVLDTPSWSEPITWLPHQKRPLGHHRLQGVQALPEISITTIKELLQMLPQINRNHLQSKVYSRKVPVLKEIESQVMECLIESEEVQVQRECRSRLFILEIASKRVLIKIQNEIFFSVDSNLIYTKKT